MKKEYHIVNTTKSDDNEKTACTRAIEELELQITYLLGEGWELQGGVAITAVEYDKDGGYTRVTVCQAVTRSTEEAANEEIAWADNPVFDLDRMLS